MIAPLTVGPQGSCPSCGYCPHCGRGGAVGVIPWQQWWNWNGPYWYQPYPIVTCTGDDFTIQPYSPQQALYEAVPS